MYVEYTNHIINNVSSGFGIATNCICEIVNKLESTVSVAILSNTIVDIARIHNNCFEGSGGNIFKYSKIETIQYIVIALFCYM